LRKLLAAILALSLVPAAAFAEGEDPAPDDVPEEAPAPRADAPVVTPASATTPAPVAAIAPAAPTATLAAATEKKADRKPFRVGLSLGNSMGSGTFTGESYFAYVASSLTVSPSYAFEVGGVKLGASANASANYEYTQPNNSLGRHFNWGDVGLGLAAANLYKNELTGISISPNVGLTLPTSRESWWRGSITTLSGGLGIGRQFGKLNLGGRLGASKTFYSEVTQTLSDRQRSRRDDLENQIFICRSDQQSCGLRGVPSLWALSGGVNASYQVLEKLGLSIGLNLSKRYAYAVADGPDEFTSRGIDSNGNPVATHAGTADTMMGSLGVSYKVTDAISASFGMATGQTPKTADGKRFRFPWYSPYYTGGYTSYSLSLSTSF
jgi:hypothetical protein